MDDRRTLVLLHGFTNTGAAWDSVLAAGAGQRYRALAPDLRGHGSAGDRRPITLDAVLDDIAGLARSRFTLAGYSQGGRIALHAALTPRISGRIDRLVLIGASPGIRDAGERTSRRVADEQLAAEIERSTITAFAERWAATPILAGLPPDLAAAAHRDRLRSTPAGLAAALRGLGSGALPSLWDRLGELSMPVVLVAGERDMKFRRTAGEMGALIPDARVVVVPGAGHAAHLEAPAAVADLLAGGTQVPPSRTRNRRSGVPVDER